MHNSNATIAGAACIGSGGTEETFIAQAQRMMSEYRGTITATMWEDYTGNRD